jgi:hypothetical protein
LSIVDKFISGAKIFENTHLCILKKVGAAMKTSEEMACMLYDTVNSRRYLEEYRTKPTFFTRSTQILTMPRLVGLILCNNRNSAQVMLIDFFRKIEGKTVSKQSLFEAREKVSADAFSYLNDLITEQFYAQSDFPRWRGFRVQAIDGSMFEIPNGAGDEFGYQKTVGNDFAQARALAVTDVMSGILVAATLRNVSQGERAIAMDMAGRLLMGAFDLFLFDRGFYSKEMCEAFSRNGAKFIMRVKRNCQHDIDAANLPDQTVHIGRKLTLRVINITLENGDTERLVTNLFDESFTAADFGEIYQKRWGVETNFLMLKERLQIEDFSSAKITLILQDFYASVVVYNLTQVACLDVEKERKQNGIDNEHKYEYRVNRNIAFHEMREFCIHAVTAPNPIERIRLLRQLETICTRFVQPISPNRSKPRTVKNPGKKYPMNRKSNR